MKQSSIHVFKSTLKFSQKTSVFNARTFLLHRNDMRKTWGVINDTLQRNRRYANNDG